MCPRTGSDGKPNPRVVEAELTADDLAAIVGSQLASQLDEVLFCGNYGDPMLAGELLEMCRWFRAHARSARLRMHTNGSGQTAGFWRSLAELNVRVTFGIDGLDDTLARYRRGASFARVLRSAESFIAAGGKATWKMIAFRHNEHQIETAEALSRDLGFARFVVKPTKRFAKAKYYPRRADGTPDYDATPSLPIYEQEEHVDTLEPPRAEALRALPSLRSFRKRRDEVHIVCRALEREEIYISAERLVFPCCWLAEVHAVARHDRKGMIHEVVAPHGGFQALRAPDTSLREIVEGPVFAEIQRRFSCTSVATGRLETCARACGRR